MRCAKCGKLRGGAIPEQYDHYQKLLDTRIKQLRKAEKALSVLDKQINDFLDNIDKRGRSIPVDSRNRANLRARYQSATDKVEAARDAIDAVNDKITDLMDKMAQYYRENPVTNENADAAPPANLDPTRSVLVPYDVNSEKGVPERPVPGDREGLGRKRRH